MSSGRTWLEGAGFRPVWSKRGDRRGLRTLGVVDVRTLLEEKFEDSPPPANSELERAKKILEQFKF
jgi:hypothetical protein